MISPGGYWTDLKGAQVCITYDPAKVSISSATASPGWNYEIAVDHTDTHIYQAFFTTQAASLSTSGPIFSFTVTPLAGPVDTSDCSVLKLRGGSGYELWPVCELVSGEFSSVWIEDTCPDQVGGYLGDNDMSHQQDEGGSDGLQSKSAQPGIDMQLNTSQFQPGQESEISVDGIVGAGAAIAGGTVALDYDASKVTVLAVRSGNPNWSISGPGLTAGEGGSIRMALHQLNGGG